MASPTRITGAAASLAAVLCAAALTACGGGGAEEPATSSATGARAAAFAATAETGVGALRLFVPDTAHAAIVAADGLEPDAGAAFAALSVATPAAVGNNVQLDAARDELYAISGHSVVAYAAADALASTSTPSRTLALPASLAAPRTLFLDTANDLLYVGGDTAAGDGEIVVYASAHTATGMSAKPARLLFVDGGVSFFTIDPLRQRLYVVNRAAGVHVFANADTASGVLAVTTTIPVLGTGLAVDSARDRLYVADLFAGLILVDQASAATPVVTATLSIDDARYVAVDSAADRAYVSASGNLYVIDNASELTAATTLNAPATAAASLLGTVGIR